MGALFSRFSLSDLAVLFGCCGFLAVMLLFGPGRLEDDMGDGDGSDPDARPARRAGTPLLDVEARTGAFWNSWPGALVMTVGGGALLYGLLALWSAGHH